MEVTGADQGAPFTATVLPLFDPLKSPASLKIGLEARATVRAKSRVHVKCSLQADYNIVLPSPPDDTSTVVGSVWGTARWGEGVLGRYRCQADIPRLAISQRQRLRARGCLPDHQRLVVVA
jgi:hypothetical protein